MASSTTALGPEGRVPAGELYPDDVDYCKWRVTNMVENIQVVRRLYDMCGYMIF